MMHLATLPRVSYTVKSNLWEQRKLNLGQVNKGSLKLYYLLKPLRSLVFQWPLCFDAVSISSDRYFLVAYYSFIPWLKSQFKFVFNFMSQWKELLTSELFCSNYKDEDFLCLDKQYLRLLLVPSHNIHCM